ncbi:hypothetical protein GCM10017083_07420 [Thalassobaculum fulvum]|uniref:Histidine phosphatase family protein n=1 Tax=Thalassobaculum fulvum TaxID=1633335 RepID=A0A918XNL1_9PROT|nr:histidine phosphatase family protein [Thalassobaculum fulvum]GHD42412.1 hypothetical protein GCM10017083_07420 [Thalassobaculum fulvum]
MTARLSRLLILLSALLTATPATASPEAWAALRQPGTVAVMRHALAPGFGDPAGFTLGDCATQRDLDARGRAQARAVGDAFRAAGIEVDRILTSRWCRCRHTAEETALAPVEEFAALDSFFADRSTADAQTEAVRRRLAGADPAEKLLLVTHQVNIAALTGRSTRSGEVLVIRVAQDGGVQTLGSIAIPVP